MDPRRASGGLALWPGLFVRTVQDCPVHSSDIVSADGTAARWLSGGGAPSPGGLHVCHGGCQLGPGALPCSPSLQAGLAAPRHPWVSPRRCLALFAFRDPPPTPPFPPLALGPHGFWKAFLSLGTSARLCPQVMLTAVGPPILGAAEGRPVLVFLTEGIGAEVAKRGRRLATHVTVMPRALPLPEGPLAQAQAAQVVGLGAQLAVT